MSFNPEQPFEVVEDGFDPSQPFEIVPQSSKTADALRRIPEGIATGTGRTLQGIAYGAELAAPSEINEAQFLQARLGQVNQQAFPQGVTPATTMLTLADVPAETQAQWRADYARRYGTPRDRAQATPLYRFGENRVEEAREFYGVDRDRDAEFVAQLFSAGGEMVPTMLAGAVGGPAAVGVQYAAAAGEAQAQEAEAAGRPDQADVAFLSAAGLGGITEAALGVPGRLLKIVNRARKAGVNPSVFGRVARAMAEGAAREGGQESLEQAGGNLIASQVAGYDPERPTLQGVGRAAALGATLGGVVAGGGAAIPQRYYEPGTEPIRLNVPAVTDFDPTQPFEVVTEQPTAVSDQPTAPETEPRRAPIMDAAAAVLGLGETVAPDDSFDVVGMGQRPAPLPEVTSEMPPEAPAPAPDPATEKVLPPPPVGVTVSAEQWADMATLNAQEQTARYGTTRARLFEEAIMRGPEAKPPPTAPPARDWDAFYEELVANLDSFSPARDTGRRSYEMDDLAQRFVDYAKADATGRPMGEVAKEFAKQDEAKPAQLRKLREAVRSLAPVPPAAPAAKTGKPPLPAGQAEGQPYEVEAKFTPPPRQKHRSSNLSELYDVLDEAAALDEQRSKPSLKVGDLVRYSKRVIVNGVGQDVPAAGLVRSIRPDGRLVVRGQDGSHHVFRPEELLPPIATPTPPGSAALASDVTPTAVPAPAQQPSQSTPAKAPRKFKGRSLNTRLENETRATGPDIISFLTTEGQMKLLSKSAARKRKGAEWFKKNASLYDDAPSRLSAPHHSAIYSERGEYPDVVAQAAYEAGRIGDPTPSALWAAIIQSSAVRVNQKAVAGSEAAALEAMEQEQSFRHEAASAEAGDIRVDLGEAAVGDVIVVDGTELKVIRRQADGTLVLEDGTRWGIQRLPSNEVIYAEQWTQAEGEAGAEFLPEEPASPPKLRAMENQGDLMANQTEDFALVGDKATDFERIQRAQEQQARDKAEAEKRQGGLFDAHVPHEWLVRYRQPNGSKGEWRGPAINEAAAREQAASLGTVTSVTDLTEHKARLLAQAKAYDLGGTIKDVTPGGYGPASSKGTSRGYLKGKGYPGGELGAAPAVASVTDDPNATVFPVQLPELVQLARDLSAEGVAPKLKERLGKALGRFNYVQGAPKTGRITLLRSIFQLIPEGQRAKLMADAKEWAAAHTEPGDNTDSLAKERYEFLLSEAEAEAKKQPPIVASKVLAHEIGHWVDFLPEGMISGRGNLWGRIASLKKYLKHSLATDPSKPEVLTKLKDVKPQLKELITWWRGSEQFEEYFADSDEMYAETFSVFLNNPQALRQRVPQVYEAFINYMERKPEVARLYNQIQDQIKSGTVMKERVVRLRESWQRDSDRAQDRAGERSRRTAREWLDNVVYHLDRRFGPVYRLARKASDPGPTREAIGNFLYRASEHELFLGRMNRTVAEPLVQANLDWMDLGEFLFHERVANERVNIANPMGWSTSTSNQRLAEMQRELGPDRWAALTTAAQQFRTLYREQVIPLLQQTGLASEELLEKITDNVFYATFAAVKQGEAAPGIDTLLDQSFGQGVGAVIYKQVGNLGDIKNPATATTLKALSLISAAYRNQAKRSIVKLMQEVDPHNIRKADVRWTGKRLEFVTRETDRVGTLTYLEDGKAVSYYVPKDIANTINQGNPARNLLLAGAIKSTATIKQLFTSENFAFWPVNFVRDTLGWIMQMPGATPLAYAKAFPKAVAAARSSLKHRKPNRAAEQALARKMLIVRADPQGLGRSVNDEFDAKLVSYGLDPAQWERAGREAHRLAKAWNTYREIGRTFERIPKIAGMLYLDEKFPDMPEWQKQEIVRERAGSPDFMQKGASNPYVDLFMMFYNPWKEGLRSVTKSARDNPYSFAAKSTALIITPTIIQALAASGLMGDDWEEMYASVPDYDLTNYLVVPLGWSDKQQRKVAYLRLPLWEPARILHGLLWQATTGRGQGYASFLGGQVPTMNSLFTVALAWMQAEVLGKNPYDAFLGREVIDPDVFAAGGWQRRAELMKWSWNEVGGSILHRFRNPQLTDAPAGDAERFLQSPLVSNALGRWIKVSSKGINDAARRATKPVAEFEASVRVGMDEVIRKLQSQEAFTDAEKRLMREPYALEYLSRKLPNVMVQQADPILKALEQADTQKQKAAVLEKLLK